MKSAATTRKSNGKSAPGVVVESEPSTGAMNRLDAIAQAAYYRAEARGFVPGEELGDWLEAEAEFDQAEGC
jgi:hypothetical protein